MKQNPKKLASDAIDRMLLYAGLQEQFKEKMTLAAATCVAVGEYGTDIEPADYVLFVTKKPVSIIEVKRLEKSIHLKIHEDPSEGYAKAKLKFLNNGSLPFVYNSTSELARFTDYRNSKPRSLHRFNFHQDETFMKSRKQETSLRKILHNIPALPMDGSLDCQITAINTLEQSFKEA